MRVALFVALALTAGCADDPCINGICPDLSETRTLLGPCRAAATDRPSCDITYSDLGLSTASCVFYHQDNLDGPFEQRTETATWRRDAQGGLFSITHADQDTVISGTERWEFDSTRVTVTTTGTTSTSIFDRAMFAFTPRAGIDALFPHASFGLLQSGTVTFTWSTEGTRWIRTSSFGDQVIYDLDDRRRITGITGISQSTFVYEGDRLVAYHMHDHDYEYEANYIYDHGGNIAEVVDSSGAREVFSYDCW